MHRWLSSRSGPTSQALRAIRQRYPSLPVGYPDGADRLASSQEHLLVIRLKLDGVERVLGKTEHDRLLAFWRNDHYKVLYAIVARDKERIGETVRKHRLALHHRGGRKRRPASGAAAPQDAVLATRRLFS